jgi:hypothetical protein
MAYLERGIVVRPGDTINWPGMLWGLQQLKPFHIGAKTALELQGKAHYISFREPNIFLFSAQHLRLPYWCKKTVLNCVHVKTNFLPADVGVNDYDFGEFSLKTSKPARAFVEHMYLAEKFHTYDEAYHIMENLQFLDPNLMQEILEVCQSIKVNRLVLTLARKVGANWLNTLDTSRINLGKGPRQVVAGGSYDQEFQITYPPAWDNKEDAAIF